MRNAVKYHNIVAYLQPRTESLKISYNSPVAHVQSKFTLQSDRPYSHFSFSDSHFSFSDLLIKVIFQFFIS